MRGARCRVVFPRQRSISITVGRMLRRRPCQPAMVTNSPFRTAPRGSAAISLRSRCIAKPRSIRVVRIPRQVTGCSSQRGSGLPCRRSANHSSVGVPLRYASPEYPRVTSASLARKTMVLLATGSNSRRPSRWGVVSSLSLTCTIYAGQAAVRIRVIRSDPATQPPARDARIAISHDGMSDYRHVGRLTPELDFPHFKGSA